MNPERWQQISRIFKSAISLDGEARAAYVKGECGSDDSLRSEVEKLIASHQQASDEGFIGGMAAEQAAELLLEGSQPQTHASGLVKGQQLGSYLILDLLGAGGMGEVYLAKDSRLDRTVALKVLSPDISSDKRRMMRFRQEAKVASSLNQPNILTIFEFGEAGSLNFLATEFIDGETLRNYLRGKRLKLDEILDIATQVLAALDAAHDANIVHRDITPENVMIRRRDHVVKVLDFGLAKVTEKRSSVLSHQVSDLEAVTEFKTAPGIIMGTINYMSPEQAMAGAVDVRTDIWSTGVMIYEMVAGAIPFSGATSSHTLVQILEKDPAPMTQVTTDPVPDELERIVSKAMAKDPDERYQSAKDMLIDLRRLKKQLDFKAEVDRTSSPDTLRRPPVETPIGDPRKKRVVFFTIAAMVLVTVGIFGVSVWRSARESRSVSPPPVPATVEERTLTYWIKVQKFKDDEPYEDPFTIAGEINFEADYQIRVFVRSPEAGHLYIFNEGPPATAAQPEFVVVFPSPTANNGSSQIAAGQVVQIPELSWLEFDKDQGVEKLWLVFAADAVPELETLKQFANPRTKGLITDLDQNKALQSFLAANTSPQTVSEKGETLTKVKSPGRVLVYAIRLEHH